MAQAIFEPNPFPYNTPTFSNLIHSSHTYLPMKMEQTVCSETSAYKIQTLGNNPEESIYVQYNYYNSQLSDIQLAELLRRVRRHTMEGT